MNQFKNERRESAIQNHRRGSSHFGKKMGEGLCSMWPKFEPTFGKIFNAIGQIFIVYLNGQILKKLQPLGHSD